LLLFAAFVLPLSPAGKNEEKPAPVAVFMLSGEDNVLMAQKLSSVQAEIQLMVSRNLECSDLVEQLKDAEKIYETLKTSTEVKDPVAMKDLFLAKLASVESEAGKRITFNSRMDLIYQSMIITCMLIIVAMIIYSMYMYSKRK